MTTVIRNTTVRKPMLNERAFLAWIDRAAPGERITYHEGHLGFDRTRGHSSLSEPAIEELNRVAGLAMTLAEFGHVLLVQRRIAEDRVAYLAIMATKPKMEGGR